MSKLEEKFKTGYSLMYVALYYSFQCLKNYFSPCVLYFEEWERQIQC